MKKYNNYTLEQFVADDFFHQWVRNDDSYINEIWDTWLKENPEKVELVNEARSIIVSFNEQDNYFDKTKAEYELEILMNKIEGAERRTNGFTISYKKLAVAASIILLAGLSGVFFLKNYNISTTHSTGYGETKDIYLPDGSLVTLNANSFLKFYDNWEEQPREVWIEGEALFKVKKIKTKEQFEKFSVYSSNLSITVLGTEFNVNSRRNKTTVVLTEGSVNILERINNSKILMKPGEKVEITETGKIEKENVKTQIYTSWKNKELVFEQASLEEIARTLEDNFGYKVVFRNPSIKSRKFTGTGKSSQIDLLLAKISKSNDLNINKHEQTITISNP